MSIGLRDQRVLVFSYSDSGSDGWQSTRYIREANPTAADGAYWARKEPVSAREAQIALQAQHEVTVVFAFADHVFVPTDGVLKHGGTFYKVTGVYIARMLREIVVHAVEATDEVYNNVIEGALPILAAASFTLQPVFTATATVTAGGGGGDFGDDFGSDFS